MTFAYSIDTQGGMSGSGVYAFYTDGQRRVVGVHVRGSALDDVYGEATRINNDVFSMIESIREQYPDSSAGC
jgi:V8-like Glu-specific endopeptidase